MYLRWYENCPSVSSYRLLDLPYTRLFDLVRESDEKSTDLSLRTDWSDSEPQMGGFSTKFFCTLSTSRSWSTPTPATTIRSGLHRIGEISSTILVCINMTSLQPRGGGGLSAGAKEKNTKIAQGAHQRNDTESFFYVYYYYRY